MDVKTLKRRILALKPFMETVATIPAGRVILAWPLSKDDENFDINNFGIWTDDPAFTAQALWTRIEWIWKLEDRSPALLASLENSIDSIEKIAAWTKDQHSK